MANGRRGRPSKGQRKMFATRLPESVGIDQIARAAGYRYTSQYISDFVCAGHGFDDLVLGPDIDDQQEQLTA